MINPDRSFEIFKNIDNVGVEEYQQESP